MQHLNGGSSSSGGGAQINTVTLVWTRVIWLLSFWCVLNISHWSTWEQKEIRLTGGCSHGNHQAITTCRKPDTQTCYFLCLKRLASCIYFTVLSKSQFEITGGDSYSVVERHSQYECSVACITCNTSSENNFVTWLKQAGKTFNTDFHS